MTKARVLANTADALSATSSTELGYLTGVTSAIQTQINTKQPTVANVSDTEIGYLDGVTSAIQTQLNAKQAVVSGVSDTEIGYLDGVTSAIQTQLDAKLATATAASTYQTIVSGVDNTEIGYLNGVTSAIQTQLNAKAPLASPTFTGNVTATSFIGYLGTTNLGRSNFGPIITPAANSQATYSGYPVGYSVMMAPSANGMPNSSHYFYFLKTAQRDDGTGWAGIAINFNTGDLYVGNATTGSVYATWKKLANEILMGTSAPSAGLGADGDVYVQYTA
jgi:hypothetical protein